MKQIVALALLAVAVGASAVEYKPRKVSLAGKTFTATQNMIPQFVSNPGTGRYVLCKSSQDVKPYSDDTGSAMGVVFGGDIVFSVADTRALWDQGVNYIGQGCVLANSDKEAQEKLWAIDAAAKEAAKGQPGCVEAYVGTKVWCARQIREKLEELFDANYILKVDARNELIDYTFGKLDKNYTKAEKNNLMVGAQEEVIDTLKFFENVMNKNNIPWTSKQTKPAPLRASQAAQEQAKPSFDCAKAGNATEKTICQNGNLAKLDASFALNYKNVLITFASPGFSKTAAAEERQAQKAWISQRNSCGEKVQCIAKAYIERNDAMCSFGVPNGAHPCTESLE